MIGVVNKIFVIMTVNKKQLVGNKNVMLNKKVLIVARGLKKTHAELS